MTIWLWQRWWYNMLKEMHFIWFLCLFVLIWLKVQVVIHKSLILSFWQHLWCEAFIAVVFLCCTSQSSLVNQTMRLVLCCLFLGFSADASVASVGGYRSVGLWVFFIFLYSSVYSEETAARNTITASTAAHGLSLNTYQILTFLRTTNQKL